MPRSFLIKKKPSDRSNGISGSCSGGGVDVIASTGSVDFRCDVIKFPASGDAAAFPSPPPSSSASDDVTPMTPPDPEALTPPPSYAGTTALPDRGTEAALRRRGTIWSPAAELRLEADRRARPTAGGVPGAGAIPLGKPSRSDTAAVAPPGKGGASPQGGLTAYTPLSTAILQANGE